MPEFGIVFLLTMLLAWVLWRLVLILLRLAFYALLASGLVFIFLAVCLAIVLGSTGSLGAR